MIALLEAAEYCIRHRMQNQIINVRSDSFSALQALKSFKITS